MPISPTTTKDQGPYQPRLPGTTDPGRPAANRGRPTGTGGVQGWRLDEKTRRAGRQGVAAARAALAGAARPGDGRQANAA